MNKVLSSPFYVWENWGAKKLKKFLSGHMAGELWRWGLTHTLLVSIYTVLMWFDENDKKSNDSLGLKGNYWSPYFGSIINTSRINC